MAEGLQNKEGSNKQFFKLKEDKRDGSKTKGQFRFFQQEKSGDKWISTNEGNVMSGVLKSLDIKTYPYEGETKENLEVTLQGTSTDYVISFGLNTGIAENLLNSIVDEPIIGSIEINCGLPKNDYPTVYFSHEGNKTKWRYSKENNNWDEVPKVITETDGDGNKIRKGVKARSEFFKKLLSEVQGKLAPLSPAKSAGTTTETENPAVTNEDLENLPF